MDLLLWRANMVENNPALTDEGFKNKILLDVLDDSKARAGYVCDGTIQQDFETFYFIRTESRLVNQKKIVMFRLGSRNGTEVLFRDVLPEHFFPTQYFETPEGREKIFRQGLNRVGATAEITAANLKRFTQMIFIFEGNMHVAVFDRLEIQLDDNELWIWCVINNKLCHMPAKNDDIYKYEPHCFGDNNRLRFRRGQDVKIFTHKHNEVLDGIVMLQPSAVSIQSACEEGLPLTDPAYLNYTVFIPDTRALILPRQHQMFTTNERCLYNIMQQYPKWVRVGNSSGLCGNTYESNIWLLNADVIALVTDSLKRKPIFKIAFTHSSGHCWFETTDYLFREIVGTRNTRFNRPNEMWEEFKNFVGKVEFDKLPSSTQSLRDSAVRKCAYTRRINIVINAIIKANHKFDFKKRLSQEYWGNQFLIALLSKFLSTPIMLLMHNNPSMSKIFEIDGSLTPLLDHNGLPKRKYLDVDGSSKIPIFLFYNDHYMGIFPNNIRSCFSYDSSDDEDEDEGDSIDATVNKTVDNIVNKTDTNVETVDATVNETVGDDESQQNEHQSQHSSQTENSPHAPDTSVITTTDTINLVAEEVAANNNTPAVDTRQTPSALFAAPVSTNTSHTTLPLVTAVADKGLSPSDLPTVTVSVVSNDETTPAVQVQPVVLNTIDLSQYNQKENECELVKTFREIYKTKRKLEEDAESTFTKMARLNTVNEKKMDEMARLNTANEKKMNDLVSQHTGLVQKNESLAQLVAEKTKALNQKIIELEEKNKELEEKTKELTAVKNELDESKKKVDIIQAKVNKYFAGVFGF